MPVTTLTRVEAEARAQLVEVASYQIELDLTRGPANFATTTTITLTADTSKGTETFLDFIGASVEQVTVNGSEIDVAYDGSRIALTGLADENVVVVHATGQYTNTGEGLHRFVDPADNEVYLYTQFEVANSRRVFTVFEQPDLKATFAFTVTAPAHWQIISNTPTPDQAPAGEGIATWAFPATKRVSSYITAIVAGPYDVRRTSIATRNGETQLGIYCRKSLTQYADFDNLFDVTARGFEFFEREFDNAYPFEKYDQIFTPEFNAGAMENAGCVTINETYIFRGKVRDQIVERRALTILHELAHMWFGDMVTMKWWNDLWLNESFAEWSSTLCQAEATQWSDAWATFGTFEKEWAYRQDQQSTTHPVVAEINDWDDVEVNFDGITYAKGAASLKQLFAFVGREPFLAGLRSYFKKFAWGNTVLGDLLGELSETSGRDLVSWSKLWLETAGVNTLRPAVQVGDDGRYTSVTIEQSASPEQPTLRPHRLGIGGYQLTDGTFRRTCYAELDVDGPSTEVTELVGADKVDVLIVNDEDLTYAKVRFDDESLAAVLANPNGFTDAMPRMLVATALWDMTRDGELAARDYLAYAMALLEKVTDPTLLGTLITRLMGSVLASIPMVVLTYTSSDERESVRASTLAKLHAFAHRAEPGSDAQLQFVGAWLELMQPGDNPAAVAGLLDGSIVMDGLVIDQDMRWRLVAALAAIGGLDRAGIDAELARDNTAAGQQAAARAMAARPSAEAKADAWRLGVVETSASNAIIAATGYGFTRHGSEDLLEPYIAQFHDHLEQIWRERPFHIADTIISAYYPRTIASESLLSATQGWLDTHLDADPALRRLVAEHRDDVARAVAAQRAENTGGA